MNIPYVDLTKQNRDLEEELLEAVRRVLHHGYFVLGPEVAAFEARIKAMTGAAHVIGVNSGTDALILALRAHDIGDGDEVITVSHSFIATASAICMVGARPVFVDIEANSMVMDPDCLETALTEHTRAVIPVHLNGYPCEMEPIVSFCETHDLVLIEDCAQAIGARYQDRHVGTFGTGCFSLHPLKILSACGDGGFISTASKEVAERLRSYRNLGLRDRNHCNRISANTRLDTIQAALLLVKLDRMEGWIAAREAHSQAYREALASYVQLPPNTASGRGVISTFAIRHPRRDVIQARLKTCGIDAKVHYPIPIHRQEAFAAFARDPLPVTDETIARVLSLPVTPELSIQQRTKIITTVQKICRDLTKTGFAI